MVKIVHFSFPLGYAPINDESMREEKQTSEASALRSNKVRVNKLHGISIFLWIKECATFLSFDRWLTLRSNEDCVQIINRTNLKGVSNDCIDSLFAVSINWKLKINANLTVLSSKKLSLGVLWDSLYLSLYFPYASIIWIQKNIFIRSSKSGVVATFMRCSVYNCTLFICAVWIRLHELEWT